jgi:hypothetical protein
MLFPTHAEAPVAVDHRPRRHGLAWIAGATLLVLAGSGAAYLYTWYDREALSLLVARDPLERQSGAHLVAEHNTPRAVQYIRRILSSEREPYSGVREAWIHSLGVRGDVADFDLAVRMAQTDDDAYVRHTAWVAAARIAPDRFPAAASQTPRHDRRWDQIGRAAGWLCIGDRRGVDVLFHWAVAGDPHQRQMCCRALNRDLAPLLEAAGRWPLGYTLRGGETWPAEVVAEIRERCVEAELARVAAHCDTQLAQRSDLRRDVGRISGARERLARFLTAP